MDLWHPPTDQPHLLEWWTPLLAASRALRESRFPWPIHVDEMMLMGRVDRGGRPTIWIYKHKESRGELYLDATGQAYRFTKTPNARSLGRFTACDLDVAVWRADLPTFVQPVFYDDPPRRAPAGSWDDDLRLDEPHEPPVPDEGRPSSPPTHPARRRGHLTVIDGGRGRPLAG